MVGVEKDFTTLMLNLYEDYIFLGPARHSILTLFQILLLLVDLSLDLLLLLDLSFSQKFLIQIAMSFVIY